jgi:hypothetical protein
LVDDNGASWRRRRRLLETSESMSVILISTDDGSDIAELVVSSRAGWPWKGAL